MTAIAIWCARVALSLVLGAILGITVVAIAIAAGILG